VKWEKGIFGRIAIRGVGLGEWFGVERDAKRLLLNTTHFHIGSCAWTYEDWRGVFYPGDLPTSQWLGWYARVFNAVEIDSTFYSSPPASTIAKWLGEAPAHFRFTCKAPKVITHQLKLRNCEEPLAEFLETMRPLHGHLGAILVQLPPSFSPERDGTALRDFVLGLPHGWRFAIEFRHADWHQPRFAKLLEEHGVCWVWNDTTTIAEQNQGPFGFLPETADFLYVRLMGDLRTKYGAGGRRVFKYKEVMWSRAAAIDSWAVRLLKHANEQTEHAKGIYVMCSNHYEGYAPATCRELGKRVGVEIALPEMGAEAEMDGKGTKTKRPRQMKLL
jgi:uncharacterized protein YecE (DUF72 family)